MINKDTITIKLDKLTMKKLNSLKYFNRVENMTTFCKKALKNAIDKEFSDFQEKVKD